MSILNFQMPSVTIECASRNRYRHQNAKKYCEKMGISKKQIFPEEQVGVYFEG